MAHTQSAETAPPEITHTPTDEGQTPAETGAFPVRERRRAGRIGNYWALFTLIAFLVGLTSGYLLGSGRMPGINIKQDDDPTPLAEQINPTQGYTLPVRYGDIGPQLLKAGAIDYARFVQVYEQAGQPLSEEQRMILREGSEDQIIIDRQNAYFLLNFFWAFGLANQNRILTEGPMVEYKQGDITGYASTGGWTLATKPITQLYAGTSIVSLTSEQQARLEKVASQIYRPCCNNPTHFPDCNHGMAMLGLLELMASQDVSEDDMFIAAKYINAYWYPRQSMELATFFQKTRNVDFSQVDARQLLSAAYSSGSGFQAVHQWLAANGGLEQAPGGGNSCGV